MISHFSITFSHFVRRPWQYVHPNPVRAKLIEPGSALEGFPLEPATVPLAKGEQRPFNARA
jgi:hypothetical protein